MKRVIVLVGLGLAASGCAKNAPATASPMAPGGDAAAADYAESAAESEADDDVGLGYVSPASFDELQAKLDALDADLSAQGIPPESERGFETTPKPKTPMVEDDEARCERICDLKEAICDVAERICGLAEEHEGESKYEEACTRAESRCEQASSACESCEG